MNRREWMAALATAVTSGTHLHELLQTDIARPEPLDNVTTLQDILPDPDWRIPDEYEDVTEHPTGWRSTHVSWDSDRRLKANYARGRFRRTDADGNPQGEIITEVLHPDDGTASIIDDHHENALWQAFGGSKPQLDQFTDWADVVLSEIEVQGCRETTYCNRIPQIYSSAGEDAPEKPYSEYVLLLRSTERVVLKVEVELQNVTDTGRSLRVAESLLGAMQQNHDFW